MDEILQDRLNLLSDKNASTILTRATYFKKAHDILEPLYLMGFHDEIQELFWLKRLLKKPIHKTLVAKLEKRGLSDEVLICLRKGNGCNKDFVHAMWRL